MADEVQPQPAEFSVISSRPTIVRVKRTDGSEWNVTMAIAVHGVTDKGRMLESGVPELDVRLTVAIDTQKAE